MNPRQPFGVDYSIGATSCFLSRTLQVSSNFVCLNFAILAITFKGLCYQIISAHQQSYLRGHLIVNIKLQLVNLNHSCDSAVKNAFCVESKLVEMGNVSSSSDTVRANGAVRLEF